MISPATRPGTRVEVQAAPGGVSETPDHWLTFGRFAGLLAVLVAVTFSGALLGGGTFFQRDFAIFGYPLAQFHRDSFWRGELPLWNPYNHCGLPFLAQWNTMTLYPGSLFYLLFPLSWALGVFCLGHLYWGGLGAYRLALRWTGQPLAAAVAGVGFAYNGLSWHSLMWPNNMAALGWMPWLLLAVDRMREPGRRRWVAAAVIGAMQMLTGAPEVILLTWVLAGACWASGVVGPGCWPGWRGVGVALRRFAGLIGAVAALAAVQLIPFLRLLGESQRTAGYGDAEWAMPATGWANFLVPLFGCRESFHGVYVQPGQYWTTSYYSGIGVLALALVALMWVRQGRVWLLGGMAALGVGLALGDHAPLHGWLRALCPGLGFMRFPIKFVVLATAVLPLLAAYGLARGLDGSDPRGRARSWRTLTAVGGLLLAGVVALVLASGGAESSAMIWTNGVLRLLFLVVILGCCYLLCLPQVRAVRGTIGMMLLLALWLDVRTHAPDLQPLVARSVYEPGVARGHLGLPAGGPDEGGRALVTVEAFFRLRHQAAAAPADDILGRRLGLYGNCNLLDAVPKVNGFYSLYLQAMDPIVWNLTLSSNAVSPGLLDFLGVSRVSAPGRALEWETRPGPHPWITGGQRPVFAEGDGVLRALFDPALDLRHVAVLRPAVRGEVRATNQAVVRFEAVRIGQQRWDATVEADRPALVVLAQAYAAGWRATVDGVRVPLWQANHAFQALEVPPGRHEVTVRYVAPGLALGALISAAAIFALIWQWRLSRNETGLSRG